MMGAGKTAVGRALAARLGVPFLDSDAEIESAANMTIPEIFQRDGEPFFAPRKPRLSVACWMRQKGILSTGGGAFLSEGNRDMITERGASVWLRADLDVLWNRVRHKDTRPLLRTDPILYATLKALYEARVPVYAEADLTVASDGETSIDNMVGPRGRRPVGATRCFGTKLDASNRTCGIGRTLV